MIGFWISFTLIAILIPIGIASFKIWGEKHFNCTNEQKKNASINLFKYWMFYWLCDLFYMACFLDNLICKFVFGCLIMVIVLMNVCFSFVSSNCKTTFQKIGLLQDFLVGIGLTVYLIYLIPEKELQTIILTIVAALYGGLITLVGVAWTIKKSEKDRKNDEILKAKPVFSLNQLYRRENEAPLFCRFLGKHDLNDLPVNLFFRIENSNQSLFTLQRLFHDGYWEKLCGDVVILPSKTIFIDVQIKELSNIVLSIDDILGNEYLYRICLDKSTPSPGEAIISEYKQINVVEMRKIEKEK